MNCLFTDNETRPECKSLWQDYDSLLADCHQVFFNCRNQLLMPSVKSTVNDLTQKYK
jgi:hypothetical protein